MHWADMKASEVTALAEKNAIAVVPIGSLEHHGSHLATGTDICLASEICKRAAAKAVGIDIIVTPTIWHGLAEMHMSLGGTITLDLETFNALLKCVCRSISRQGFSRVLLLNGHGGNMHALNGIVNGIGAELNIAVATVSYWQLAQAKFKAILEDQAGLEHACEGESSMMLALAPQLCDPARFGDAIGLTSRSHTESAGPAVHRWRSFEARSSSGILGNPARASAFKGERLLEAAAEDVANLLSNEEFWSMPF